MIDYKYGDLYLEDSIDKQIKIESEDGSVITNEDLYSEEMTISESLCSQESLTFGCCEASMLTVKIANRFSPLYGQKIVVSEALDGNKDEPFQFGIYRVESDEPAADHIYRDITAYDLMYDILNADAERVAEWYDMEILPGDESKVTMKEFRTSFLDLFGIEQEEVTLCNDDMIVEKTIGVTELSGSDVIRAICEINGCFGHINREGKFQYVTLYPLNDESAHNIDSDYYIDCVYEDFETLPISKLQIRSDEDDIGATTGDGDNVYIVQDNFLVYGKSTEDLQYISDKLYEAIAGFVYRPATISVKGNPCYEVGDGVHLDTTYQDVTTYILKRTLKGIQALTDTYESDGVEQYDNTANSIENSIIQLKGRSNILTRSLELTISQITNVEENLQSTITQTADEINARVSQVEEEINNIDKVSIIAATLEYYVSDSDKELIGGEWSTDEPVRGEGKYIWVRTAVVTADGETNYSEPACITAYVFSIDDILTYYAVSESPDYYPPHNGENAAIVGESIIGEAIIGNSGEWTLKQPIPEDGEYVWAAFLVRYTDGSEQWMEPILLTDDYARQQVQQLVDQYAEITVDINSITQTVYGMWEDITENYVTSEVMNAAIVEQIADSTTSILLDVAGTYATKDELGNYVTGSQMDASIEAYVDSSLAKIEISVTGEGNTRTYVRSEDFPDNWEQRNTDYGTFEIITDPITGSGQCYQITQGENTDYYAAIRYIVGSYLPAGTYHLSIKAATLSGYDNTVRARYAFDHTSGSITAYLGSNFLKSDEWTEYQHDFELDGTDTEEFQMRLETYLANIPVLYKDPELYLVSSDVLGSMAGIIISTDDRVLSSATLDLTEVRQAFADDPSEIVIGAGTIAFVSNTLLISSDNCLLTADGSLTVYNGTFYGMVTSVYEDEFNCSAVMNGGGFLLYYEDDMMGTFSTRKLTADGNTTCGIAQIITSNSDSFTLGRSTPENEEAGNYTVSYVLNNGADPWGYEENHIFWGDVRFVGETYYSADINAEADIWTDQDVYACGNIYTDGNIYADGILYTGASVRPGTNIILSNGHGVRVYPTDSSSSEFILSMDSSDYVNVGNADRVLNLRGSRIRVYLSSAGVYTTLPNFRYAEIEIESTEANVPTYETIYYNVDYDYAPLVYVTAEGSQPGVRILGVSVGSLTKSSCRVYATRNNTGTTTVLVLIVYWHGATS